MNEEHRSSAYCGQEAEIQNAVRALETHRGEFYPDPDFGSLINETDREPRALYALCFARQALSGFDGIYALSAEKAGNSYSVLLCVNGNERPVTISV